MVRKKRKGVIKEAQAEGAAAPRGVDLKRVLDEVPADAALPAALGGGSLAQWYAALCDAQGSLYEQLKRLQLFRSQCKALQDADVQLKASIWRLAFRLSVAPRAQPLRKNLGLILDVLAADELRAVAAEELRAFLGDLWAQSELETPERRVQLLDRMLHVVESPFLARALVENPVDGARSGDAQHLLQFVACCAEQLEALGAPIVEYHEANQESDKEEEDEAAASTNVVLLASERCSHALKSVIVLATMKDALDRRLLQCRGDGQEQLTEAFLRIVKHCVLLLQTNVVHKDLLTQAGLAYCLVLRLLLQLLANSSGASSSPSTLATKLLLQAAYPELKIVSLDACDNAQVRAHIEKDVESFGDLSRLAVCRGLLNSLANEELALPAKSLGLDEEHKAEQSALDAIFTGVQQFCDQVAYNTRLFAFQVLEAFLRRAVTILQKQKKEPISDGGDRPAVLAVETLTNLTTAVLLNWEHPSKKVNQFMAAVFAHIVNYFVLSGDFQEWSDAILPRLVELPPTSRAKYGSLTLLVAEAGAKPVLQASPALLSSLLSAVGQKDYAAPAAANLFAQILDDLSQGGDKKSDKKSSSKPDEESMAAWRLLWLPDVVGVLLSRDANLRSRVAMYVIPLLLKKDPGCVPVLIKRLQEEATKEQIDGEAADVALWAELEVLKFARKKMAPEKLVGVSMNEIERGLRHAKVETRGTAFDALCSSLKSTSMPTDDELRLVKYYLVVNGKEIGPAGRMNTLIGLKTVLIRIKETMRLASKNQTKPNPTVSARDDYAAAVAFKQWVELFVATSVYPGALPQRLTLGLEVLLLYVQLFGFGNDDVPGEKPARNLLLTGQMVTTLLNMLISAWDSIRSLAFTILDLYPDELPGYSTREELRTLVGWAVGLCSSPRQRESDAGAMFIRLLFQKCSGAIQRFGLTLQRDSEHQSDAVDGSKNADVAFVLQLTQVILSRVDALSSAEIRRGESPLVHGFLLSLHYVLENVAFDKLSDSEAAQWPHAMTQIFTAIHQSMRASLAVVGDATSGAGDEELSASFAGVVGEVSAVAKTSNSALRVDCRGHLIVDNGDGGVDGEEDDGIAQQRAVVGSWLAARECGAILELLMRRVPLPSSNPAPGSVPYFTVEMAQRGGETLLNSLFELKHKGAVATAYQAFEGVCRAFLAHGEQNAVLGGLPARWADRLLERLERSEQHFVLRRSSGFAFSFVAILRAEPRNSAAVILPKVMSTLLRLAGEDTDTAEKRDTHQEHHSLWRARVHALNILKLICQDGVLAEDVARYVVDMFELAVRGFDCGSWAVRNSSMMLFAAATQRAIGDKRIADGGTRQQVSSDDVFSRFQQLRGFLARELSRLLASDTKPSGALGGAAPPGLYPLLLFLSRLRPGDEDDQRVADASASPCDDGSGLASFVPLVMKCASQPTMAIRHMAAKVVASIVSDVDAASVLSMLCEKLPQGIRSGKDSKGVSHNYVHGVLAQIHHLTAKFLFVGAAQRKSTPISKDAQAEFFEVVVTKVLPSTMWLWAGQDAGSINAVIRAEIVATVDVVLRYYTEDPSVALSNLNSDSTKEAFVQTAGKIQAEVELQLLQRCDSDRDTAVLLSTRPGMYVLDRALVSIWFSLWTMPASGQQLHALVQKMLVCHVLQIRKKAIKKFANKLVVADMTSDAVAELQTLVICQFLVETHPKVRTRQLQILVRCQLRQPIADAQPQRQQLQTQLVSTLNVSADTQVLAPTLELLALMAYHTSASATSDDPALYQILGQEIEQRSDENQPLILREAAASALHHSGLLLLHNTNGSVASSADLALVGWTSALRLLQDDDVRVRAVARYAVQEALAKAEDCSTASPNGSLSDATVLPLAVEYIAASFARTEYGVASLSKVLFELVDAPSVLAAYAGAAGAKAQDWDDLYRRIFESESSNYYAERDVLAQNIVFSLLARSGEDDGDSIRLLRQQVLTAVASALTTLNQEGRREEGSQWLGGITYYSDVFAPLFGLLAAGVAVLTSTSTSSPPATELQPLASQVRELAHNAYVIHSNDDATHPLVLRAFELLASKEVAANPAGTEPVTELLYLTPHWTALGSSRID